MNPLSTYHIQSAELALLLTTLVYFLMNGAQLFETAVLIPRWSAQPPASLKVLQGPYAPDLKTFWLIIHSVHEVTFLAAIGFCWQLPAIRNGLLLAFGIHFLVRAWTIVFFAPRIISFQKIDLSTPLSGLDKKVRNWRRANYLRVGLFFAVSFYVTGLLFQLQQVKTISTLKPTTMQQRLSVITIGVDDLPAQQAFYKEKLGWQPEAQNKDIVFFKLNGLLFSLFDRKALAKGAGVPGDGNGFRALTLAQIVNTKAEVDKLHAELKGKGVTVLQPPMPTPFGGYYFTFADPENNVLEIAYNPYIPLNEHGEVITHKSIDDL